MKIKFAFKIGYPIFMLAITALAVFTYTDCQQMDINSGQVRWAKEVCGIPLCYFYESTIFSSKAKEFDICISEQPNWVVDSRISPWFSLDNSKHQFHGVVWNCNMVCQLMDTNVVSVVGQKTFVAYTLQQLNENFKDGSGSFSAQQLIDLCGGPMSVQQQVMSIPLTPQTGNLLEMYIETQFAPFLPENYYYPDNTANASLLLF